MKEPFRFRPSLERLEARDVPAAVSQTALFDAVLHTLVNQSIMQGVAENMIALGHPSAQFTAGPVMQQVVAESNAAEKTLGELQAYMQVQVAANPFMSGGYVKLWGAVAEPERQAQMNEAMARNVGNFLGVSIPPDVPPIPPPPAPTPPTDAGMTNTRPDPNDPNWVAQANGLKTWDIAQGHGAPVAAGDKITVFYTGWLAADPGTKFDSRRSPSAPVQFELNKLIQGWQQGVPGMRPGGIRRLFVPSALGYGAAGSPPNIPPNADLIFEIKVISHT